MKVVVKKPARGAAAPIVRTRGQGRRSRRRQIGFLSEWSKATKAMATVPIRHWPPLGDPIPWLVDESNRRAEDHEIDRRSFSIRLSLSR